MTIALSPSHATTSLLSPLSSDQIHKLKALNVH